MNKIAVFLALLCFPVLMHAQQEPEDIAAVTDAFQDAFFESLTQKGIENYDRAITALEKCRDMQPSNPAVYQELGKNYQALRNYPKAYEAYEKAAQLDPRNMWPWVGMYDVCYESRDYNNAITILDKLIGFKKEYREELVSLYMTTAQFDKALTLINELNDQVGKSDMRENYKAQILRDPKYQGAERKNLLDQIAKNPKDESNYLALIRLYSDSGQDDKAMEVAKKLEKAIPTSEWAHVNLYTTHLASGDATKALKSMEVVFASRKIDNKIKHRVLNEFLIFSRDKPQYDADLERVLASFTSERDIQVAREIGKFYHEKKMWDRAQRFYALQLKQYPDDLETRSLVMDINAQSGAEPQAAEDAEKMIERYPLEPKYYLYAGQGYNARQLFAKAKSVLEAGLEYVIDNPEMEAAFYEQLSAAFLGLGDKQKADAMKAKASKVRK